MNNNTRHILIVDDEEDLCEILRFNLEAEGFTTTTANSAEQVLDLLAANQHFDLLLLDVMMDGMSGYDLAIRMREQGDTTPIIFLTARSDHNDQMQGFAVGADDYIAKPFSFDTVLARIQAVLRRSATNAQPTAPSNLTRREYLIYQLFVTHPGRYFTRDEIIAAVWPDDTLVGARSVDVHIARLRKKLGAEGTRIAGKTGFGYGLV